jgi:hypothetical protein
LAGEPKFNNFDLFPKRYPSYKFVTSAKEVVVMRKSRFSEAQIIGVLKQAEAGMTVAALCPSPG